MKKIINTIKLVYIIFSVLFFVVYIILMALVLNHSKSYTDFLWNHQNFFIIWYIIAAVWTYGTGVLMILKSTIHFFYPERYYKEHKIFSIARFLAGLLILIFSPYILYIFCLPVMGGT
jgi:hypothetical protein